MHTWEGYIRIVLTPEQEVLLSLALQPKNYNPKQSSPKFNQIQNALFDLGAMEATKVAESPREPSKLNPTEVGHIEYLGLFTTFFPNQWNLYKELFDFLQSSGIEFSAYFGSHRESYRNIVTYNPAGIEPIFLTGVEPQDYPASDIPDKIRRLKEWAEISDIYTHIPPPQKSLFAV